MSKKMCEKEIKVLFIHGRLSSFKTSKKVSHLKKFFNVHGVDMTDCSNWDLCLQQQEEAIKQFEPDVIVGSSFGGAIAIRLLQMGKWKGPTVLLAHAFMFMKQKNPGLNIDMNLPDNIPIVLIHGTKDDVVPIEHSRESAKMGTPGMVELIELDDGHSLDGTIDSGVLAESVRKIYKVGKNK